ncbi:MAG: hypothetical protein IRY87_04910 [Acetobacteraceae bacterium]|nr:hypothetical protein [Acetobacteraceae bacterium]
MADATPRVSVRLSVDGAQQTKQELREVGEAGQRSLERIKDGTERASRALDLLDAAVRGVQIAGLAAGIRVMARNISLSATFDLGPATLSVQVTKRRVP